MKTTNNVERLARSVAESCAAIGIGRSSFYKAVQKGQIRVLKSGRRTLVPAGECEAYLKRLADGGCK